MKKVISIILAAVMLMSCFAFASFAGGSCTCGEGVHTDGEKCRCCRYCPNIDTSALLACYNREEDKLCCEKCSGVFDAKKGGCDCNCGCVHCKTKNQTGNELDSYLDKVFGDQEKKNFVDSFQDVIKMLSDIFDELFDKIFAFLKIDGVIGKGETIV